MTKHPSGHLLFYSRPVALPRIMFDTELYTLVPYEYHSSGKEREFLSSLFELDTSSEVLSEDITSYGAAFIYAVPAAMAGRKPAVFGMLMKLKGISVPHKLLVRFSEGMVSVALADRDHLLLLCSYRTASFVDALYHVFAALREVMFEPDHTLLHYNGAVSDENRTILERYFQNIVEVSL